MSSDTIITVENLGKKYRIHHQAVRNGDFRYVALRDVLAEKARSLLRAPFAWRQGNTSPLPAPRSSSENFWALKGVSFEVKRGECVGIIGRNGAGKSTLLKILSRITEPTEGRVTLDGRVASLLKVGTGFHPELTGRENVYLNGAILGMTRAEIRKKFDEIVAFAEVEKFLDTPVKRYSSGMYMRLAFSIAAHLNPDILIVDEVLAVGDAAFQKKCLGKMEQVGHEGRTVLFVSHNMPTITRLCQRAILLQVGRMVNDGPAHEVTAIYLNSGQGTTAMRVWPDLRVAPGDNLVRLCAARVRDGVSGNISAAIDIRHPVQIEIEYQNSANDHFPYANVQLFDATGVCLFASGDFVNQAWRHEPRRFDGRVKSTCFIPGNLLAEGQIRVLVGLTTQNPNEVLALERDAVSFMVVDHSEGDGARGEWAGHFPGAMRPLLDWQIERLS